MKHYYILFYKSRKIKWKHMIVNTEKDVYKCLNVRKNKKMVIFSREINFSFYRKKYLLPFVKEFLFLLRNGIAYLEAFTIMKTYENNIFKKKILEDIIDSVQQGNKIVDSFSINSEFFGKFFLKVLFIGEESGNMESALELLISELEEYKKLKKQIFSLLFYPCFLIFFSTFILIFLFSFIFPKLLSLFQDTGIPLPLITRILLQIKYIFPFLGLIVILCFIGIYLIFIKKYHKELQHKIDRFLFNKYYCSGLFAEMLRLRMSKYLELLLKTGFSFQETFSILEKEIENLEFCKRFLSMKKKIYKGEKVHIAFRELGCFSEKDLYFIALGEEGGNIEEIFQKIAMYTQEQLYFKIQKYLLWLEPSIFIIFGLCIGIVIIAVYLPMFSLSNIL